MEWPPARFMLVETIPSSSLLLYKEWKIRLEDWKKEKKGLQYSVYLGLSLSLSRCSSFFLSVFATDRIVQMFAFQIKVDLFSEKEKTIEGLSSDQTCSISKNEGNRNF